MSHVTAKENVKKYQQTVKLGLQSVMPRGCKKEGKLVANLVISHASYLLKIHDAGILQFESEVIEAAEASEYANNVGREFYE